VPAKASKVSSIIANMWQKHDSSCLWFSLEFAALGLGVGFRDENINTWPLRDQYVANTWPIRGQGTTASEFSLGRELALGLFVM
jgi:hypothetical protein